MNPSSTKGSAPTPVMVSMIPSVSVQSKTGFPVASSV